MKGTIIINGQPILLAPLMGNAKPLTPDQAGFRPMQITYPPTSKYQFSRAKWYTAPLNGNGTWRFSDEYNEIIAWCTEMFGAHPTKQDAWSRWYVGLGFINFRDERDYQWFVLRWGA